MTPPTSYPAKNEIFLGHSVQDGRIRYLSVSQISKFDDSKETGCNRRWAYEYIFGKKEEKTKKQIEGSRYAAELEHFLKTGEEVLSPILQEGKKFFPRPGSDLEVEKSFAVDIEAAIALREQFLASSSSAEKTALQLRMLDLAGLLCGGIPLVGAADVRHRRGEYLDPDGLLRKEALGLQVVETADLKTTSRIHPKRCGDGTVLPGYAKTDAEVLQEIQMLGYAVHAQHLYPETTHHRLSHLYCSTGSPRGAAKRTGILPADEVHRRWERVEGVAHEMEIVARISEEVEMREIRPNFSACNAWNRPCPHRTYCPRMVDSAVSNLLGKEFSPMGSLFDQLAIDPPDVPASAVPDVPLENPLPASSSRPTVGKRSPASACVVGQSYFVDCADGSSPRLMRYEGSSEGKSGKIYFFIDSFGARVKLTDRDFVFLPVGATNGHAPVSIGQVSPPDAPVTNPLDAAAPLRPEVIAEIEDPEIRTRAETHARAHAERQREKALAEPVKVGGRCPGGNQVVTITMTDALRKRVACPVCGELRRIPRDFSGKAEMIFPGHNRLKPEEAGDPGNDSNGAGKPEPGALPGQGALAIAGAAPVPPEAKIPSPPDPPSIPPSPSKVTVTGGTAWAFAAHAGLSGEAAEHFVLGFERGLRILADAASHLADSAREEE